MSDIPIGKEIDPKAKAIAVIILLLVLGMIVGLAISKVSIDYARRKYQDQESYQRLINLIATVYTLSTSIICMNIFLLLGLLRIYIQLFRSTKSGFLLGLSLFIGVLLIQSFLSLPLFPAALGESLSLYGILPNMFETIALIILLYLSME